MKTLAAQAGADRKHLGVEVATRDAVRAEVARFTDDGFPSGERWEIYTVFGDSQTFGTDPDLPV